MAKKSKTVKSSKKEKKVKTAEKIKSTKTEPKLTGQQSTNLAMAAFYAKQLEKVESNLQLVSNSIMEAERVSSGILIVDWVYGGGFVPGMSQISGEEQAGKTTIGYHTMAVAKAKLMLPYNTFYDAEGTVSPTYTKKIWEPFGLDTEVLLSKRGREQGFYYFRNNVIEKMFDYVKRTLEVMPEKHWIQEAKSWGYFFPKRNDNFKRLMDIMGVKPDKKFSTDSQYVALTENSGPEGFFMVDSFASLLTKGEEEKLESGSSRLAMEAAEFSKQLKRVSVDLADKKIVMLGTNQLRDVPMAGQYTHPDDRVYEPGGKALKFYSQARGRVFSRSVNAKGGFKKDEKNSKFGVEPSVEVKGGEDRYAYKEIKNTKNKFGKPGLKSYFRVWVSDADGNPRGIDPAYDVYYYLLETGQLVSKAGKLTFNLKPSIGKKRAEKLNAVKPFKFQDLKTLIIGEYTNSSSIIKRAVSLLGIDFKPNLRESLFNQLKTDISVYESISNKEIDDDDDTDFEEI